MNATISVRQMTSNDLGQVKQIINLSFPIIYRYFAVSSLYDEGHVLVAQQDQTIVGFAKLIDIRIGGAKYGCILWIAVHPSFRRKGIAVALTNVGTLHLKKEGANAIFASTQRRNIGALSVLRLQRFRRIGFFGLQRLFGWQVFEFYSDIWFAPGEVVLIHE